MCGMVYEEIGNIDEGKDAADPIGRRPGVHWLGDAQEGRALS
jgi:hypothetical protein